MPMYSSSSAKVIELPSAKLENKLTELIQWKNQLRMVLAEFYSWLKEHRLLSTAAEEKIRSSIQALNSDELTIAIVAEFSRGKTNLINAIFFAEYGTALLPSAAGRTTMCPMEIFYDKLRKDCYLKALPIETLAEQRTLSSFKRDHDSWAYFPLDTTHPESLKNTLKEVRKTVWIRASDAERYGLAIKDMTTKDGMVEVPKWRHILLSFPHPLLKKGLRIIDTPGFNALGSEPELIFSLLPTAHAILFLLAADTGTTSSDMEVWKNYIRHYVDQTSRRVFVALNKIDTLWDGLLSDSEVDQIIGKQCQSTAEILGVEKESVFAISAQKALIAKIKNDQTLFKRSGVSNLEKLLSSDLLTIKQELLIEAISNNIEQMLTNNIQLFSGKRDELQQQRNELSKISHEGQSMVKTLLDEARALKVKHRKNTSTFLSGRQVLSDKADKLAEISDIAHIDHIIEEARQAMLESWTTGGMKKVMQTLFDQLNARMSEIVTSVEEMKEIVKRIYHQFENVQGFKIVQPRIFSAMKYRVRLDKLYQEAEAFRSSTTITFSEKHIVIRRFTSELAEQARRIFLATGEEAQGKWIRLALEPLKYQIRDHRDMLNLKTNDLRKIGRSRNTIGNRLESMDRDIRRLTTDINHLIQMKNKISQLSTPR
jgi:archaellum component FlaC